MKKLLLTCFVLLQFSVQSQNFDALVNSVATELKNVETSKYQLEQEILAKNEPISLYTLKETSKKGKVKQNSYEFNFADIDANTVRYKTLKDKIEVYLTVKQNQKMVKKITNEEKVSYVKEIRFIAENIENARSLVEKIKSIIPAVNKITENKLSLHGYEDRVNWLLKNIQTVKSGDKEYEQTFVKDNSYPANFFYTNTISKKNATTKKVYGFNLSNINPNSIQLKNKGSDLILSVATSRRLKGVKITENGEQKNYVNKFEIVCKDIENARSLQKVLQDVVPLANQKFEASLPTVASSSSGFNKLNAMLSKTTVEDIAKQNISGDCIVQFNKEIETSKKKDSYSYEFNLVDFNKQGIEVNIKGKKAIVELETNAKNKFIKVVKNNDIQNYTNKIELVFNGVEDAVSAKKILQDLTKVCNTKTQNYSSSFSVLQQEINKVLATKVTYEQKIEQTSDGNVKFTQIEASDKKSDEMIQEFKLSDINPKKVVMKVSGKKVMVEAETNYQEKIIKTYKNGEIKNYTNTIMIFSNSIENGRKIVEILKKLTARK